jgi:hypothetical protein
MIGFEAHISAGTYSHEPEVMHDALMAGSGYPDCHEMVGLTGLHHEQELAWLPSGIS